MTHLQKLTVAFFTSLAVGVGIFSAPAFARETVYMDEDMYGVAESEYFVNNHWGNMGADYTGGNVWYTGWKSQGYFKNADDESGMIIQLSSEVTKTGSADIDIRKFFEPNVALNGSEQFDFTFTFDTLSPELTSATGEVWFCYNNQNGRLPMMRIKAATDGYSVDFASSDSGEFRATVPDNNTGITIEPNKSYTAKFNLRPNKRGFSRLSCVMDDGETQKAAIIENWELASEANMSDKGNIRIFVKQSSRPQESIPFLNLKHIKIESYREDTRPEAVFSPLDGAEDVSADSIFSVSFPSPVNDITADDVTIDNEASVSSVSMEDNGRRAVFVFDGIKPESKYNIAITGVTERGASASYDYTWSFGTASALSFGRPAVKSGDSLKRGANDISVSYKNTGGKPFDATIVAAVCSGSGSDYEIKSVYMTEYTGISDESGTLDFSVNVDARRDRFLKVFVLKDGKTLIPLAAEGFLYTE